MLLEDIATEGSLYHTAVRDGGTHEVEFLADCDSTGDSVSIDFSTRIEAGGSIDLGQDASMTFLHVDGTPRSDLNENSLVVMLDLAGTKMLLPGDSGGERADPSEPPETGSIEDALLQCCEEILVADILVLGHHGSMTSSRQQCIEAVEAMDYIVSSGPMNFSGRVLPDEEVIELVSAQPGASVFRTDEDDASCETDSDKIGADNDGGPGGCHNIHIHISSDGPYLISVLGN